MKKLLIYFISLNSIFAYSQADKAKANLKADIQNSIQAYNESDYEKVLNYFPDFVFDKISKEEMLKEISKNHESKVQEINEIKIDTIVLVKSIKYARFYINSEIPTYGIKAPKNINWTFIDLNEQTKKYIPVEIRKPN